MASAIRRRPSPWPDRGGGNRSGAAVPLLTAALVLGALAPAPTRGEEAPADNQAGPPAAHAPAPRNGMGLTAAPIPRQPWLPRAIAERPDADLQPTEWAYRELRRLHESGDCAAGPLSDLLRTGSRLSRFEAADLVRRCLPQAGGETDQQRALIQAFSAELAVLPYRGDSLNGSMLDLAALQFSTTTRLDGIATFVLGANRFGGSATTLIDQSRSLYGASTFNYDLKLIFNTSFTGRDLLRMRLRAGNFNRTSNSFYGAGPSALSELEVAFQERSGPDVLGLNRLYYQRPFGDFTLTLGPRVEQDAMLAIWPSVYPASSVLDVMTFAGAIGALNLNLGAGAGLWWQKNGLAISINTIAAKGGVGNPQLGGIASEGSGTSSSLQIGYQRRQWAVAAIASWVQNGFGTIPYGTEFVLNSFQAPGSTWAYGLSGYWQPLQPGWIPSISAGFGLNTTQYNNAAAAGNLVSTSQSWSVGVQWLNAIARGHSMGFAIGQPTYATRLVNGTRADDGNWVWEGWLSLTLSDQISLTPAVFYLSRPLGANTPAGRSFEQLGVLIKTSLRF